MPNWVDNRLIITSDKETLNAVRDKIKFDENNNPQLARSLYPMPEDLHLVSGTGDELFYWVDENGEPQKPPRFNEQDTTILTKYELTQEEKDELKELHGQNNWYDWNIANYGSKWPDCYTDVRNLNHDKQLYFAFESAWAPLVTLAQRISADYKCKVVLKHFSLDNMSEGTIKFDEGMEYYYLYKDISHDIYPSHILREEE